jgi:putative cell wall-binding protein
MKSRLASRRSLSLFLTLQMLMFSALPALASDGGLVPTLVEKQIQPLDAGTADAFGYSVALFGDTAVIGARNDAAGRGSAYVYTRQRFNWVQQQKLTALDAETSDFFGYSVAVYGDTAIVGAWGDSADAGSAYVYVRSGTTWSFQQKIVPLDPAAGDRFGLSVAISGDTAIIGADVSDANGVDSGCAYVFVRSGTTWTEQQKIAPPGTGAGDRFGAAVALFGGTAVIGALCDDDRGTDAGSAYVFTRSGTTWSQQQKLTATDGAAGDYLGFSVAVCVDTIVVGAFHDDDEGSSSGSAYVFARSGTTWATQKKLTASDAEPGDEFGWSVAVSGGTIAVGARSNFGAVFDSGAAYVYTRSGAAWAEHPKLVAGDGITNDQFGAAVAVSGGTILVGAPANDGGAIDSGSVYGFTFDASPLPPGVVRVAGANRYATSIECSKRGFPAGAPTVVVATGANWPDALGGSSLAGASRGPLVLTPTATVPAEVRAEILRLGATKAYVLGSAAAVATGVESALVAMLGRANVTRLGGASRYETARKITDEVALRMAGIVEGNVVFVATGANFPDATAAAPIAARLAFPISLANPATGAVYLPPWTAAVFILGSTSAVSAPVEAALDAIPGLAVQRIGGTDRYETAALIAQLGISFGMSTDGAGLATGTNFPDALSGGAMLGNLSSVILLTPPGYLGSAARLKLEALAPQINTLFIIGGTGAVSASTEAEAKVAGGL